MGLIKKLATATLAQRAWSMARQQMDRRRLHRRRVG
jgi:hypothetical protein